MCQYIDTRDGCQVKVSVFFCVEILAHSFSGLLTAEQYKHDAQASGQVRVGSLTRLRVVLVFGRRTAKSAFS